MCRAFFINRLLGSVNNNQYVLYNNSICAASLEKGQLQRVNKQLIWLKPTAEHCFDTINGGDSSKSRHKLCPCNRAAQEGVTQLRPWVSAPLVLMGNDICHRHSIEVRVAFFFFSFILMHCIYLNSYMTRALTSQVTKKTMLQYMRCQSITAGGRCCSKKML